MIRYLLPLILLLTGCITTGGSPMAPRFEVPRASGCIELDGEEIRADFALEGFVQVGNDKLIEFTVEIGPASVALDDRNRARIPAKVKLDGMGFLHLDAGLECDAYKVGESVKLMCRPGIEQPSEPPESQPPADGAGMGAAPPEPVDVEPGPLEPVP